MSRNCHTSVPTDMAEGHIGSHERTKYHAFGILISNVDIITN